MIGSDYHTGQVNLHLSRISANYNPSVEESLNTVVLTTIAHLLGRQTARDAFHRLSVVNKDTPATGTGKDQGDLSDVPCQAYLRCCSPSSTRLRSWINWGFAACRQSVQSEPSLRATAVRLSPGREYSGCRECSRTWKTPDTPCSLLVWSRRLIGLAGSRRARRCAHSSWWSACSSCAGCDGREWGGAMTFVNGSRGPEQCGYFKWNYGGVTE